MDAYGHDKHIGWFYSYERSADATLLACQVIEIVFIIGWVSIIMAPFFLVLNYAGYFRSDPLEEVVGLDRSYHEAKVVRDVLKSTNSSRHDIESLMMEKSNYDVDDRVPQEMYPNAI